MTVAELIQKLEKMPQDLKVTLALSEEGNFYEDEIGDIANNYSYHYDCEVVMIIQKMLI